MSSEKLFQRSASWLLLLGQDKLCEAWGKIWSLMRPDEYEGSSTRHAPGKTHNLLHLILYKSDSQPINDMFKCVNPMFSPLNEINLHLGAWSAHRCKWMALNWQHKAAAILAPATLPTPIRFLPSRWHPAPASCVYRRSVWRGLNENWGCIPAQKENF